MSSQEGQDWLARHMRAEREAEEIQFPMEKLLAMDVRAYLNPDAYMNPEDTEIPRRPATSERPGRRERSRASSARLWSEAF
eukprot:500475-Heterocapsa_arctica.AAC.1